MRRVWLTSFVLFLATLAVFSRVLLADFVQWDDDISVSQNPHIQGLDWGRLRWMFSDASYAMRYKPLTWLTYALVHQVGGLNPLGYHLTNLLLHCLNTVLVFVVIRRLLTADTPAPRMEERLRQTILPAAGGALLWAVNPLRVEPVARVTDLTFCLQLLFLLISLWCYLRAWGAKEGGQGYRRFYWCSVAAFALAMFAYPFAFAYGVVLLVLDWYPLRRFAGCGRWWRDARAGRVLLEKIPFLLLGGTTLTTIVARLNPTGIWAGFQVDRNFSFFERAMQVLYVWAYYAWKPWLPFHLSPLYTTLVGFNPSARPFWLSAGLVIGVTVLLMRRRNQWPWALASWISYLVLLIPVWGITERPHYTADRYDYLPGLVWAVAIAATLWHLSARPKLGVAAMTCALALSLFWGALSLRQIHVWQNSETLFTHVLRELGNDPYAAEIHWRLGKVLAKQGRVEEAESHFAEAVRIKPGSPEALSDLGLARMMRGKLEEGIESCRAAIAVNAGNWRTHANLARALCLQDKFDEAVEEYRTALGLNPDSLDTRGAFAAALVELGRTNEACQVFEDALRLKPDDAATHFQYASLRLALGQAEPAALHFREVLRYTPKDAEAHRRYGLLLLGSGKAQEAVEQFREAIRLQPGAEVHYNLATALLQQGQPEQAVRECRESLRLKPDSPAVLNDLAWLLAASARVGVRNGTEAVSLAERACQLTQFREPLLLGTLAAAYAEAGRFEEARSTAQKAIALAEAAGQTQLAARNRALLELYQAGKPCRE